MSEWKTSFDNKWITESYVREANRWLNLSYLELVNQNERILAGWDVGRTLFDWSYFFIRWTSQAPKNMEGRRS